jgi:phosphoglycolate phosphatase-like HAD superfamily hydrolase
VARERIRTLTGRNVEFTDMTIIGDTPLDVDCARACGARAVAVATGQHTVAELSACNPNVVLPNFADAEAAARVLLGD